MFETRKVVVNNPSYLDLSANYLILSVLLDLSANCLILSALQVRILASCEKVGNICILDLILLLKIGRQGICFCKEQSCTLDDCQLLISRPFATCFDIFF